MGFVAEPSKEGYFATGGVFKFGESLYVLLNKTQKPGQRLLFLFAVEKDLRVARERFVCKSFFEQRL